MTWTNTKIPNTLNLKLRDLYPTTCPKISLPANRVAVTSVWPSDSLQLQAAYFCFQKCLLDETNDTFEYFLYDTVFWSFLLHHLLLHNASIICFSLLLLHCSAKMPYLSAFSFSHRVSANSYTAPAVRNVWRPFPDLSQKVLYTDGKIVLGVAESRGERAIGEWRLKA